MDSGRNSSIKLRENQIFVRNLHFDINNDNLLELFQDTGPVKHVSVAMDSAKKSKGYGFVTFSLPEDAKAAVDSLQGKDVKGRKIKLELAHRTGSMKHRKDNSYSNNDDGNDNNNINNVVPQEELAPIVTESIKEIEEPRLVRNEVKPIDTVINSIFPNSVYEPTNKDINDNDGDDSNSKEMMETSIPVEKDPSEPIKVKLSLQLIVMGVPAHVDKKSFKRTLSKISRKSSVELIKQDHPFSSILAVLHPPGRIYQITTPSKPETEKVMSKLNHAHTTIFERKDMSVDTIVDVAMKGRVIVRSLHDIPTDMKIQKRCCRVIIRNLSFHATEENVLTKMSTAYGPIREVTIPKISVHMNQNKKRKSFTKNTTKTFQGEQPNEKESDISYSTHHTDKLKSRGFAFVTFLCMSDAERAVKESGKLKICNREVAIDYCISKEAFSRQATSEELAAESEELEMKEKVSKEDEDSAMVVEEGENSFKKRKLDLKDEENDDDDEEVEDDLGRNDIEDDITSEHLDDGMNEDEDENESKNDFNSQSKEERIKNDVEEGCTVFVRDLPYDAEVFDLKQTFRKFGKILFAVIVKDKETQAPKGTAFVKFENSSVANSVVNEVKETDGIQIKDRLCRVDLAVGKDRAQLLTSQQKISRDKRNIYLSNEGLKFKSSNDEIELSALEKEKRQRVQSDKKKKLQNPLFFVSPTRLSIRNLSKEVGNNELLNFCRAAITRALKKKLVSTKDLENQLIAQGIAPAERVDILSSQQDLLLPTVGKVTQPGVKPIKIIRSAKVMFDLDKIRGGAPQSRSFGFVEFQHHCHALACLREISSTPKQYLQYALSPKSPLLVEFTLENIRKVKMLEERALKSQQNKPSITIINPTNHSSNSSDPVSSLSITTTKNSKKRSRSTDMETEENVSTQTQYLSLASKNRMDSVVFGSNDHDNDNINESNNKSAKKQKQKQKQSNPKIKITSKDNSNDDNGGVKPISTRDIQNSSDFLSNKIELNRKDPKLIKEKQKLTSQKRKDKVTKRRAKKAAMVANKIFTPKKSTSKPTPKDLQSSTSKSSKK